MGSNSQNLRTAYLGEFLSLCLANQGEVIHAIYTGTMGSNSQNLRTAYLGEFLSLCLANQGEVIHATPLEAVCFAHCTYHLVLSPRS